MKTKRIIKNNKGFTLFELIMVITILAILAITNIPKFFNFTDSAHEAQRDAFAASVRDGIIMQFVDEYATTGNGAFPAVLDDASNGACTDSNPCFEYVLKDGRVDGWAKNGNIYTHLASSTTFKYKPATGAFN